MMAAKLKTGDQVQIICGRDKGATGTIVSVDPKAGRAVVDGLNLAIKHVKPSGADQGGIRRKPMPIHLSNLALIDPQLQRQTRVGFRFVDGVKTRFAKKSGAAING